MEWSIQARAHACQECGHAFRAKEPLHTLLVEELSAYRRMDVCDACWGARYAEGANHRRGFVSYWQGSYSPPPPPAPEAIKKETAATLLRRLVEQNDPAHAAACFILAVMLERKRLLRVKGQATEGGRRLLIYEQPKTGDVFTIPDPDLQLDQLEAVQRDVARLLEAGTEAPAIATPPAGAAATVTEAPTAAGNAPGDEPTPPSPESPPVGG